MMNSALRMRFPVARLQPCGRILFSRPLASSAGGSTTEINKTEYVHPLSQIVLSHLQVTHAAYLDRSGMSHLNFNRDGTFTLRHDNYDGTKDKSSNGAPGPRIWTSYDTAERKHFLNVQQEELVGRYLLQDNTKPAWQDDKRSVSEKIQEAVDEMIRKLDTSNNK